VHRSRNHRTAGRWQSGASSARKFVQHASKWEAKPQPLPFLSLQIYYTAVDDFLTGSTPSVINHYRYAFSMFARNPSGTISL
jgi:hypothetical protein